jgi:hypothetical protein
MNRGKLIFILISLSFMAMSIQIYLSQNLGKSSNILTVPSPKAKMSGYDIYKYKADEIVSRSSGKQATFSDGGILLCEDGVKMVRTRKGMREEITANIAMIKFPPETKLASKDTSAESIDMRGDVEVIRGDSKFTTDWLTYTESTKEAFTDHQVRFEQSGQFIAAEQGMTYNMQTESIRMRGGVFGSVRSNVVDSASKSKEDKK